MVDGDAPIYDATHENVVETERERVVVGERNKVATSYGWKVIARENGKYGMTRAAT